MLRKLAYAIPTAIALALLASAVVEAVGPRGY